MLSDITNITYGAMFRDTKDFQGDFESYAVYAVGAQCSGQSRLSFEFATQDLAHEFQKVLGQAVAASRTKPRVLPTGLLTG
jgi:hypothetical protein